MVVLAMCVVVGGLAAGVKVAVLVMGVEVRVLDSTAVAAGVCLDVGLVITPDV